MKKYFLLENGLNIGPFTHEELKAKKLQKSELVWSEGMAEWQQCGTIDELKSIFAITPPPPPKVVPPPPPATPTPPPAPVASPAPPPPPSQPSAPPPAPPPPSAPRPPQFNSANQTQFNTDGYIQKPGGAWIIAGYIFSIIGGFLGWVIGAHLKFSNEKLPNGSKVKKFDEKSQQHGLILIIIGGISWIIWLITIN